VELHCGPEYLDRPDARTNLDDAIGLVALEREQRSLVAGGGSHGISFRGYG
jgi:hypothetical protein